MARENGPARLWMASSNATRFNQVGDDRGCGCEAGGQVARMVFESADTPQVLHRFVAVLHLSKSVSTI